MALIVEDGTGLPGAESYLSVADADAYHAAQGTVAWEINGPAVTIATKEMALRRATVFLDGTYGGMFSGTRRVREQALLWPRVSAFDDEGFEIDYWTIPVAIKAACAELAVRAITGDLTPDRERGGEIAATSVSAGPVSRSVSYASSARTDTEYAKVDLILSRLLGSNRGGQDLARA